MSIDRLPLDGTCLETSLWAFIEQARALAGSDPQAFAAALNAALNRCPSEERRAVLDQLIEQLDRADHWDLLDVASTYEGSRLSARAFLELRLWLVAQGRACFEQALSEPHTLTELSYAWELGVFVLHDPQLGVLLDGEAGELPAAARHGEPRPSAPQPLELRLAALFDPRNSSTPAWMFRGALLLMLVIFVVSFAWFGWWAWLIIPIAIPLVFAVDVRLVTRHRAMQLLDRARATGSAKLMRGRHRYELHFAGEPPDADFELAQARVAIALAWLVEQARSYGHELQFECTAIEHGLTKRGLTRADHDTVERAHLVELTRAVRRRVAERERPSFVIVFMPETGVRACALPRHDQTDELELCVCPLDGSWPGTIAHEILHLFGAPDLYFDEPTPHDRNTAAIIELHSLLSLAHHRIASWSLTRSVMRMSRHPHAVVDPLTAYAVGWRERPLRGLPERLRMRWAGE